MKNTIVNHNEEEAFATKVSLLNQSINEKRVIINTRWAYFSSSKDNQDASYQEAQNSWTTLLFFLRKLQNELNKLEFGDNNGLLSLQNSWTNVESQHSEFLRLTETKDITPKKSTEEDQLDKGQGNKAQEAHTAIKSTNPYEAIFQYLLPRDGTIPTISSIGAKIERLLHRAANDDTMQTDIKTVIGMAMKGSGAKRIATDAEHAANNAVILHLAEKNGDTLLANQIKLQFGLAEQIAANDTAYGKSISSLDNQQITDGTLEFLTKEIRGFLQINKITPVFKKPGYYTGILTKRGSRGEEIKIPVVIQKGSFGLHERSKITQINQDGSIGEEKELTILKMKLIPNEMNITQEEVTRNNGLFGSVSSKVQKLTKGIKNWWNKKAA